MADLKILYENLGLKNVTTYIQSGNVIFESNRNADDLVDLIEKAIQKNYGFEVPVQLITTSELNQIASDNPYISGTDVSFLYLTFLEEAPKTELLQKIVVPPGSHDQFKVINKTIYLYCPKGYGHTKLSNTFFESKLKIKATTRNWKTVLKVIELTQQIEQGH